MSDKNNVTKINKDILINSVMGIQNSSSTETGNWQTKWSGNQIFTSSGSFTVPGLAATGDVKLTASAVFTTYYYDPFNNCISTGNQTLDLNEALLPNTLSWNGASVNFVHDGDKISVQFENYEYSFKGYVTEVVPTQVIIKVVKQNINSEILLTRIKITSFPNKTNYKAGEILNPDGLEVVAVYSSGEEKPVQDYTINKTGFLAAEDTSVTISYKGFNATFSINVSENGSPNGITSNYVMQVGSHKITHKLNRAGMGTVNLYDSVLQFVHTDVSYLGDCLPMYIAHVYNSKYAQSNSIKVNDINVYNYENFGNGWKLNFNQCIMPYTDSDGFEKIVYIDSAGEEKYYTKTIRNSFNGTSGTVYINDEYSDNIILKTLTAYNLYDGLGNYLSFDKNNYRLNSIHTYDGYDLTLTYGNEINEIIKITDGSGRIVNLSYNSNQLLEFITEPTGKKTKFEYDSSKNLISIKYLGADDVTLYESKFDYVNNTTILTAITDPVGEQIKYEYTVIENKYAVSRIVKSTLTGYITDTGVFEEWYNNYDWVDILGSFIDAGNEASYNDKVSVVTKSGVSYSYHFKQNGNCYMQYENDGDTSKYYNPKNIVYFNYSDRYLYEIVKIPKRASSENLIVNGSFEEYGPEHSESYTVNGETYYFTRRDPNNWVTTGTICYASSDTYAIIDGTRALRLQGSIYQDITLSKISSNSDYFVSCWAQVPSLDFDPTEEKLIREIKIEITYKNGTSEITKIPFENKNISWQFAGKVIHIADKNSISGIRVFITNDTQQGFAGAYFDDIRFEKIQEHISNGYKPYLIAKTNTFTNGEWQKVKYTFDQITELSIEASNFLTAVFNINTAQPSSPEDFIIMQQNAHTICCLAALQGDVLRPGNENADAMVKFNDGNEFAVKDIEVYFPGDTINTSSNYTEECIKDVKKDTLSYVIKDDDNNSFTNTYMYDAHMVSLATDYRNRILENTYEGVDIISTLRPNNSQKKLVCEMRLTADKNHTLSEMDERHTSTKELKTTYTYNTAGDVTKVVFSDGREINYEYDQYTGELTKISTTVGTQIIETVFTYIKGYLVKINVNDTSEYIFKYDGFGRILNVFADNESIFGCNYVENFNYSTGNINDYNYTNISDSGVSYTTYYDKYGRAVKTLKSGSNAFEVTYDDETGQITQSKDYYVAIDTGRSSDVITHNYAYDEETGQAKAFVSTWNNHSVTKKSDYSKNRVVSDELWIDGERYVSKFEYEKNADNAVYPDNVIKKVSQHKGGGMNAVSEISYINDNYGRNSTRILRNENGDQLYSQAISYLDVSDNRYTNGKTTGYIAGITDALADGSIQTNYTYTDAGEIYTVSTNSQINERYRYDSIGRLTREDNRILNKTVVYSYDISGNLTSKVVCGFTLSDSDPTGTAVSYGYASDGLKGRLISYNGKNLSGYNAQPYSYYGTPLVYFDHKSTTSYWEMTWNGRVLKTMQKKNINGITSSESISFRYDSENIRINKIVNGSQIDYIYVGSDLIREKRGDIDITYIYGLDGVIGFEYKEADGQVSRYYYLKNIQGDVTNILDNNGNIIVKYAYDAWGNHKVLNASGVENTSDDFIGNINPIRYRGYYYDKETNLYYLISRYYDPEIGRFISPDHIGYALIGVTEPNGLNLYAYCLNNPVMYSDQEGTVFGSITALSVAGIIALMGIFVLYEVETTYHPIENALKGLMDIISDATNSMDIGNDIDVERDWYIREAKRNKRDKKRKGKKGGPDTRKNPDQRAAPRLRFPTRKRAKEAAERLSKGMGLRYDKNKFGKHFHTLNPKFKHWHFYFSSIIAVILSLFDDEGDD